MLGSTYIHTYTYMWMHICMYMYKQVRARTHTDRQRTACCDPFDYGGPHFVAMQEEIKNCFLFWLAHKQFAGSPTGREEPKGGRPRRCFFHLMLPVVVIPTPIQSPCRVRE